VVTQFVGDVLADAEENALLIKMPPDEKFEELG
jgi:hypothetical protein